MCHWAIWIQNKAESTLFLFCVIFLKQLKAGNWNASKRHSWSKIYTHILTFSKYEIVIFNQKMALQSSWANWNHRDAAFKILSFILSVPFFLSGNTPVPVSSVFTKTFFFPWQRLTFPKVHFFKDRTRRQNYSLVALTGFHWNQLVSHCWFQWELIKARYKLPGRPFP